MGDGVSVGVGVIVGVRVGVGVFVGVPPGVTAPVGQAVHVGVGVAGVPVGVGVAGSTSSSTSLGRCATIWCSELAKEYLSKYRSIREAQNWDESRILSGIGTSYYYADMIGNITFIFFVH